MGWIIEKLTGSYQLGTEKLEPKHLSKRITLAKTFARFINF